MVSRRSVLRGAGAALGGFSAAVLGGSVRRELTGPPSQRLEDASDAAGQLDVANADYYVAPDGSDDNQGTESNPLASVDAAVSAVESGETVIVEGGVYERSEPVIVEGLSGSDGDPITIAGRPGENPIFSFEGPYPGGWNYHRGMEFRDVEYLVVRNLTVRNSPSLGVQVLGQSSDNVFRNVAVLNNNLAGFGVYEGSSENVLMNVVAAYNYDRQNGGNNADGIQFSNAGGNVIVGAKTFENSDDGVDLWGSRDVRVARCRSWGNGRGENGNGNGFKLGGGRGETGEHFVARNVAFGNRSHGFTHNGATLPIEVYNNTAWNNALNFSFFDGPHVLANNISSQAQNRFGNAVDGRANTWNLDIDDPGFASFDPTSDRFLHLMAGSPCIGAGYPVEELAFSELPPDIGAFEYDGSSS